MIDRDRLAQYLDGVPDVEVERDLAGDADALREVFDQRRLDAALRVAFSEADEVARIRQSILTVVQGASETEMKERVLTKMRRGRARWWWGGLLAATAGAMTGWWWTESTRQPEPLPEAAGVVATNQPVTRASIPARKPKVKRPERDWMRQPFADSSPWNQRVPANVVAVSCGLTGMVSVSHSELMVPVFMGEPGNFPWAFRPVVLVLESNRVFELRGVVAGNGLEAVRVWTNDLRGAGICAAGMCGPRRSGMSALGGLIRVGEARAGIEHALAITVPVTALSRPAWVWPASAAFGLPAEELPENGNLHLGSRVLLPADLPGLGPVGRALQVYGGYIVDAHTNPDFTVGIFVERGVADELPAGDDGWLPSLQVIP